MRIKDILTKVGGMLASSPPFQAENDKRRAATLTFLLLLLLAAFTLLIVIPIRQKSTQATDVVLIADAIILFSLLLTRLGKLSLPAYLVPFGLLILNMYMVFYGQGKNNISLLGLPVIIALGGLLLGKRGALTLAGLCILCFGGISVAETHGLPPNTGTFAKSVSLQDLIVVSILLATTAVIIYFLMNSLPHSLESTRQHGHALQSANEDLQHYTGILEQRTRQLLTGAKVARAASTLLEPDVLCQQVVDMVSERFGLYFVSLYLVDEKGEWANLYAGTGEAGKVLMERGHRLKVGSTSMIGWCIANQKARIALDVGNEAVRFSNPLLPDTRSELALPLISHGEIIGGLGIQSAVEAAFTEEDITTFQAMADQLANAISNARLYHQLQRELMERKRVELEIRTLNAELEQRVAERTRELLAANENLKALSRLKDEFLANVSHELRTPLTSIVLYHGLLEKQPQNVEKFVKQLKRETERLARLIEDLLYLSRLDQGHAPFNPVQLDLNRLAQEYVTDRTPLALERRLSLNLASQAQLPHALADEKMIGQVLSAILTNALNYTPAGGSITVSTLVEQNQGGMWTGFAVMDTGPGIPVEDQERLFERFYRGKSGRTSSVPGTGLGLAIAKEIVTRNGGRIELQSDGIPGKGTTFFVWLPVAA
ncbi:MAG: ATP-binding protein [Anaerolineales bacterium]